MSYTSLFTISPQDAGKLVRARLKNEDEGKHCYTLQITLQPLYSDAEVPNSCYKKLPRLVNGIPLGAGLMSKDQMGSIRWRYIEGGKKTQTYISEPIHRDEAEETKRTLKDRLAKQSPTIFGDMTVKATIVLSQCFDYDDDVILNDIAVSLEEGLHFRD